MFRDNKSTSDFSKIIISISSPEQILERSYGEITQPETVNYRTHKPEMKGLFCERVFGPIKDWECHCGKYRRIRYKNVICDRCGVEVTEKKVRRERMGHIELVVPVAHIWYFRSLPNKIGSLLGLSSKKIDQVVYYERYVVIQPGVKAEEGVKKMDLLSEDEYLDLMDSIYEKNELLDDTDPNKFIAKMGSEALEMLLKSLELDTLSYELRDQAMNDTSQQRKTEALKRLKVVEAFRDSQTRIDNKPEWMVMRILPVIPPELRPLIPLEGGRFATSDLNDLYRRVIIRNNRLKRLIDIKAPEVILRNEKRMLQEAVDSLFDNSRKANSVASEGVRPLKSLSDILKGKQGRFRQNLLGKRVDYSGRSVIVVGPDLKLHECGLPKGMAAELFKPFIIRKLLERGVSKTVKSAKRVVDQKLPVIWDILENVLKGHPILLNRAPTLHRLGIQAFQPKLIEGKAIQLHPLVCTAYNADFDGDMMAVHVPLGQAAIAEASLLMLSSHNILNPSNGIPIVVPSKDIVLGLYYLTKEKVSKEGEKILGEGTTFYSPEEVIIALNNDRLSKHARIKVRIEIVNNDGTLGSKIVDTIAGRVLFNEYLPKDMEFINELLTSKKIQAIITEMHRKLGAAVTAKFLDDIKSLGFYHSYIGGMTFGLDDVKIPKEKDELIKIAQKEVDEVLNNYYMGLITDTERYNQVIDIWTRVNTQVTSMLMKQLEEDQGGFNSVFMMMHSGARGSREQVRQLGGMRGLMAKPQKSLQGSVGEIIENPILSNFKEGLDVTGYFISTHGARKGLADMALKTADAGYLTRRLVDVAQDIVIKHQDCKTLRGLTVSPFLDNEDAIDSLYNRILGRVTLYDVVNPKTNDVIVKAGEEIIEEYAAEIETSKVEELDIRSVLTCKSTRGVCAKCYGRNLATGKLVQIGEAVGVIAAQSIGEPGTQLTMRTFHVGGAASNIAAESKLHAKIDGLINFDGLKTVKAKDEFGKSVDMVLSRSCEVRILDKDTKKILTSMHVPYSSNLKVKEGDLVKKGQEICFWDPYNAVIISEIEGKVEFESIEEGVTFKEEYDEQTGHKEKIIFDSKDKTKNPCIIIKGKGGKSISYNIPVEAYLSVEDGDKISPGQILVKIPRIVSKSRDITGGLPRVTELFEARSPSSNTAVVSEIDGIVEYGGIKRGNREIFIEAKDKTKKRYLVPLSKHILVQDGDYVKAGIQLSDGIVSIMDILAIKGPTVAQDYIVNEIQSVYRLQGVRINNKHIEIIVKQMMQKVEITEPGDTVFLPRQIVSQTIFREENDRIIDKKVVINAGDSTFKEGQIVTDRILKKENSRLKREDKKIIKVRSTDTAVSKLKIQGITRASVNTDSFISAASFQETSKVLSEAAILGKLDELKGLKENVVVGHRVPAGTGLRKYEKLIVTSKKEYDNLVEEKDNFQEKSRRKQAAAAK
ncbi:MAG: DNA-directed RNA polymerase subunit beta' [Bacteroidetes bacterium]|nr:DNA-directed RNA polymerase subunit beta' [Bacteroidota bacterium]